MVTYFFFRILQFKKQVFMFSSRLFTNIKNFILAIFHHTNHFFHYMIQRFLIYLFSQKLPPTYGIIIRNYIYISWVILTILQKVNLIIVNIDLLYTKIIVIGGTY